MRVCIRLGRRRPLWQLGSPTIAGRCTNCCHSTYRRRVGHHPGNVGGPRIYESVLLSDGVETTVSCRAIFFGLITLFRTILGGSLPEGRTSHDAWWFPSESCCLSGAGVMTPHTRSENTPAPAGQWMGGS